MATVHFAPNKVVKYIGSKSKEFSISVARPKPILKKGDMVVVSHKIAFNLVHKGFGEFIEVDNISFTKADLALKKRVEELEEFKANSIPRVTPPTAKMISKFHERN